VLALGNCLVLVPSFSCELQISFRELSSLQFTRIRLCSCIGKLACLGPVSLELQISFRELSSLQFTRIRLCACIGELACLGPVSLELLVLSLLVTRDVMWCRLYPCR
jgi:hypothetical protein